MGRIGRLCGRAAGEEHGNGAKEILALLRGRAQGSHRENLQDRWRGRRRIRRRGGVCLSSARLERRKYRRGYRHIVERLSPRGKALWSERHIAMFYIENIIR